MSHFRMCIAPFSPRARRNEGKGRRDFFSARMTGWDGLGWDGGQKYCTTITVDSAYRYCPEHSIGLGKHTIEHRLLLQMWAATVAVAAAVT